MAPAVKRKRTYNVSLRQEQAQMTRQRILEAARRLLSKGTYSSVTMEEIAKEAGVAYQTVYAVFGSKLKLAKEEIKSIVDLLLKHLREQMATHEVTIELTDEAKDLLVDAGYDPAMGARPLRRAIQRLIEDPLADFVLGRTLEPGSTILVARKADEEAVDITVVPGEITPESVVTVPPSDEVAAAPEDTGDDD